MGFALIDTMFLSAKDVNVSKIPMGFFFFSYSFLPPFLLRGMPYVDSVVVALG